MDGIDHKHRQKVETKCNEPMKYNNDPMNEDTDDSAWLALLDSMSVQSEHVESGIASGISSSRGVFTKALDDGGNQERAIAARYRGHADALALSHPRTAGLLGRISVDYQRSAQREHERAQQRDLD